MYDLQVTPNKSWWIYLYIECETDMYLKFLTLSDVYRVRDSFMRMIYEGLQIRVGDSIYILGVWLICM